MAPQIDFMVKQGLIDPEAGRNHPDRNCLTSVILGDRVAKSDCPNTPFQLEVGDIVVVSSDGLQYLEDEKIQKILHRYRRRKSAEICGYLLEAIEELGDPDQDNCSFSVIKLNHSKPVIRAIRAKPVGHVDVHGTGVTRVVELEDGQVAASGSDDGYGNAAMSEVQPANTPHENKLEEVEETAPPAKVAAGGK